MFVCPDYVLGESVAEEGFEVNAEWSVRMLMLACAYPFFTRRDYPLSTTMVMMMMVGGLGGP
jgi:hypothetical protein